MKLHERIFFEIKNGNLNYKSFSGLFQTLSKKLDESVENVARCVNKMLNDGELVENSRNQLVVPSELGLYKGVVNGNPKGFAFISPSLKGLMGFEVKKGEAEDIFVPASMLFGALDGDEVLYRKEGKDSGVVVKILRRGNKEIVGKVVLGNNSIFKGNRLDSEDYYLIADNPKFSKPVLIPKRELKGAKDGDRVVLELTFQPEGKGLPVGRVREILFGDDVEQGVVSILCENQIPSQFPEKVLSEAEGLSVDYESERKRRVDLTEKTIVTIDGADAKDLDDAISLEREGENYVLGVHIADVGHYVTRNSEIDKEAFLRGTSVYLPGRVYPMLPKKLSNDLCSLNPNEEKLTLSVEIVLNQFGEVVSSKIFESIIKSCARLTYTQVQQVIDGQNVEKKILGPEDVKQVLEGEIKEPVRSMLLEMEELSQKLSRSREGAGALYLDLPETYFEIQDNKILDVRKRERTSSYKLIENFMVLANRVVAETFCNLDVPFVYRIHGEPSRARIGEVVLALESLGAQIKQEKKITPKYIQKILEVVKKTEFSEVGSKLVLRALEKAIYSEQCLGHFGLALQFYCHFTSPIRRYPDLTIHRIIKEALSCCEGNILISEHIPTNSIVKKFKGNYDLEEFVIDSALQSSERERKADQAERDGDDLFKAKFMEDKIGQEYVAKISGVSSFGIFVALDNTVEGLIKIENLPPDDYIYDDKKFVLKGKKRKFIIGQSLKVKLISSNVVTRKIEFLLKED